MGFGDHDIGGGYRNSDTAPCIHTHVHIDICVCISIHLHTYPYVCASTFLLSICGGAPGLHGSRQLRRGLVADLNLPRQELLGLDRVDICWLWPTYLICRHSCMQYMHISILLCVYNRLVNKTFSVGLRYFASSRAMIRIYYFRTGSVRGGSP